MICLLTSPEWLAEVAARPKDVALVHDHLIRLLESEQQPLGKLQYSFSALFTGMFAKDDQCPERVLAQVQLVVRCIKVGIARLHALVLDVLPPLQNQLLARLRT